MFSKIKSSTETGANKKTKLSIKEIILIIIPIAALIAVAFASTDTLNLGIQESTMHISALYMVFLFFSGIIAAMALVIPGFSGALVLLLLGVYPIAINAISNVRIYLMDIANFTQNFDLLFSIIKVGVPLGLGIIVGGLSTARLIEKLLQKFPREVYSVVLGLLVGSCFILLSNRSIYSELNIIIVLTGIFALCAAAALSFFLGKKRV